MRGDVAAVARNIFSIGRERRDEDQLTEMLAWLLEAAPAARSAIVTLAFGRKLPTDGFDVFTQHVIPSGRLDALLLADDLVLVVESKIDSLPGDDQVGRYLEWIAGEHRQRLHHGLLLLTAHAVECEDEKRQASALGVVFDARRWHELHDELRSLVPVLEADADLSCQLIREFLQMLTEEGLVPVKPMELDELRSWQEAARRIDQFHDYFRACREAIATGLGATIPLKPMVTHLAYAYQEYSLPDQTTIAVGIQSTDAGQRRAAREVVMLWIQVAASGQDWPEIRQRLRDDVPSGWQVWKPLGDRARIWKYLDDVIGEGSFDVQREQVVAASRVALGWLSSVRNRGASL